MDGLQELAELAVSYSAAYERSRAASPFGADARAIEDAVRRLTQA